MVKLKWLAAVSVWCLAWGTCPVHACQYNVREVGFIDVGIEPYRLIVYLPGDTTADQATSLKHAVSVALAETNIRFESVTTGADANQPALDLAKAHGLRRFPAAVLVSPDGPSMPVDVSRASSPRSEGGTPSTQPSLAEAVSSAVGNVLDSPTGRQILEKCADTYGVVLLIQGPDPQRNQAMRETISTAVSRIGEQLESLPKPIRNPPELVVLDRKSLAHEQVLLWTLRLKAEDVNQPCAAVFYGRGRWIGPLFKDEMLTADNLTQLLSVIGADCECSLDHRWLQGTLLPARWDEGLQQKVVQSVGFDPENPMTKMEMISIVRRGMGGSDYPGVPFDYREIQVGGDAEEDRGQKTPAENPKSEIRSPKLDAGLPSSRIIGQVMVGSLAGVAVLAGVTSLLIVLRARKP